MMYGSKGTFEYASACRAQHPPQRWFDREKRDDDVCIRSMTRLNSVAFDQYEGENGTHAEFIEGLCASDMKKTSDDLAIFLKDCV